MIKNYYELEQNDNGYTHIKIETGYDKGGMNYLTYKENKRGYYVYVMPLEIINRDGYDMISYSLGKGYKRLIKEVSRASKKAEEEADTRAKEMAMSELEYACERYGLKSKGGDGVRA